MLAKLITILACLITLPLQSQYLVDSPIPENEIKPNEEVDHERLREILEHEYTVIYIGTRDDWHLFKYRWYSSRTSMDPFFTGVFRCSRSEVKIREEDIVLLSTDEEILRMENRKPTIRSIGEFSRQVIGLNQDEEPIELGPNPDLYHLIKDGQNQACEIECDSNQEPCAGSATEAEETEAEQVAAGNGR